MTQTAIIIGTPHTCRRIEQQLDLLDERPVSIGWVLTDASEPHGDDAADQLGHIDQLEAIIARRRPSVAIVSLPAVMHECIAAIRTRLRRLHVPDRFMPTIEDQLAGVGPRTNVDIDLSRLIGRPARVMDDHAIKEVVGGRCVLITGAGGSIGSELARIVARYQPRELILMDRSENALFEIDRRIARTHPHLPRRAVLHDVVNASQTLSLLTSFKPNLIFHAAAHKHVPMMEDHPAAAIENNFFGTRAVADAAHAIGAERLVFISTDKAVNPTSIMGATKRLAELYIQHINQRSATAYSIVRFGNVLGSSGSVLEIWARQIADGGPLTVTDPAMTRYFMTIPEAASLVIQSAALIDEGGDVFLLDMGDPVRIVDLARRFAQMHGLSAQLPDQQPALNAPGSIAVVFTGIRPGEKLHEELSFDAESMRPTPHPEINIWCLEPPDSRYMERVLSELTSGIRQPPQRLAQAVHELLAEADLTAAAAMRE